jgi:1,4-dihydroxy-2-naphthoate octaprenyltransferase
MNWIVILVIRVALSAVAGWFLWLIFFGKQTKWLIVPLGGLVLASAYVSELVRRRRQGP